MKKQENNLSILDVEDEIAAQNDPELQHAEAQTIFDSILDKVKDNNLQRKNRVKKQSNEKSQNKALPLIPS